MQPNPIDSIKTVDETRRVAANKAVPAAGYIDEYLAKWATEYTETCEATRVRAEQSEEIMDLKLNCFNKNLINAAALINVLGQADETVVEKAIQAVSSLSGFSDCHNINALRANIPPRKSITYRFKHKRHFGLAECLNETVKTNRQRLFCRKRLWWQGITKTLCLPPKPWLGLCGLWVIAKVDKKQVSRSPWTPRSCLALPGETNPCRLSFLPT